METHALALALGANLKRVAGRAAGSGRLKCRLSDRAGPAFGNTEASSARCAPRAEQDAGSRRRDARPDGRRVCGWSWSAVPTVAALRLYKAVTPGRLLLRWASRRAVGRRRVNASGRDQQHRLALARCCFVGAPPGAPACSRPGRRARASTSKLSRRSCFAWRNSSATDPAPRVEMLGLLHRQRDAAVRPVPRDRLVVVLSGSARTLAELPRPNG
jgi:hypothetical protein